ncbi:MAG TPA: caspase family protein [Candidatus Angelobacter sp.]|jgi:uncharacterized caspase-like protein|nr:caspase family protein [Candidatus Angelobacter sp.]
MRAALVVGINDYGESAPSLHGCVSDAQAIASILETHGDGSVNFSVKLLIAPPVTITKSILRNAIKELFIADSDMCLFFFSGHGTIKSTGGYIVTPDSKKYDEGISMDEIATLASQSHARDRVILLDCLHSGVLGVPTIKTTNMALMNEGLSIFATTRNSEFAQEIDAGGVFASLIVDALQGGAADLLGNVTMGGIYAYVDQALGPWDQRPIFKTNVARFSPLRSIAPPIAPAILRKICTYFPSPEVEISLDPSYEFTQREASPEHVSMMKDLQKYASLGLVVPVGEQHMYFAAINSKSCRLTTLGYQFWKLAKQKMI